MKLRKEYLHRILSDALSYEIIRYVDMTCGGAHSGGIHGYDVRIKFDDLEARLARKFIGNIREFLKDNELSLIEPERTDYNYNERVEIDDVPYVITEDQLYEYRRLMQESNAINAAKYLSKIFSLPLSVTYPFAKNNTQLKTLYE
jgi:hypothetical protein